MAGRQDIQAGRAYVSLYVQDSALVRGLNAAGKQLQSFGAGIAKMGGTMMGMGGAVLAPLAAMAKGFADAGSALADMSARTGVGVETLSALGFAAGMTGASIEDVEKALSKMARAGIGADKLGAIADKIAAMTDPAQRTAFAIKTFGKSGASLIPMLSGGAAGLAEFRAEAERLGIVMSSDDATAADLLGDAMDKVKASLGAVRNQIGAALAPTLTMLAERLATSIGMVIQFVRSHRELIVGIAAAAVGLLAAGAALTAFGGAIALTGLALSGLATIIGIILSPLGLLVAGLAAGVAGFITFTETGQWLANTLMSDFATAFDTVQQTISGITDALKAGEFRLAGEIAMTGLKLAFFEGTNSIRTVWIQFNKDLVGAFIVMGKKIVAVLQQARTNVLALMTGARTWLSEYNRDAELRGLESRKGSMSDREYHVAKLDIYSAHMERLTGVNADADAGLQDIDGTMRGWSNTLDEFGKVVDENLGANLTDGEARIAALRDELSTLRTDAATAVGKLTTTAPPGPTKPGGINFGGGKDMTAASFSSTALVALGQGGGTVGMLMKVHDKLIEQNRIHKLELEELKLIHRQGGAMSMLLLE